MAATGVTMCSSFTNIIMFLFIHGEEKGWMCLALCTIDTLVNASALVAVGVPSALLFEAQTYAPFGAHFPL